MGTPAFNDAAKKIQDEERAADKAREAADAEKARKDIVGLKEAARGVSVPDYSPLNKSQDPNREPPLPKHYPSKYEKIISARKHEQAGETPEDADKLATMRGMPEYTKAHEEMLRRLRAGEDVPLNRDLEGGDDARTGRIWFGSTVYGEPITPELSAMLARREAREAYAQERARTSHHANRNYSPPSPK